MTSLVHLGQITPGRRNAQPGSKDYDYSREYIKLKRWAERKYGIHERKALNGTRLPRLPRREAIQIATWWKEVTRGIKGGYQAGNEVIDGVQKMEAAAYGSADAARKKRAPTALDEELAPEEAAFFWAGMGRVALSIGTAKMQPTLFDKGVLAFESLFESAGELPERLFDASTWLPRKIIQTGKEIGDDVEKGIDKLIKLAKWTGIIGGGLLATYIVTRFVPKRDPKALPPGHPEGKP